MDTLMRTKHLESLGFERPQAEGLVHMVKESIDEEVAKKSDLVALKSDLKLETAILKSDMAVLKSDMAVLKSELKSDIAALDLKIDRVDSSLR